jgi:UDP-perosamine 4-acetyltransferase
MRAIIVIGAGGHARVVADVLRASGRTVLGFLDRSPDRHGLLIDGFRVLGGDDLLQGYPAETVALANGIGSTSSTSPRRIVYERLSSAGYAFDTICHPSAVVAPSVRLDAGVQVMAATVIQPGVAIGVDSIVNTGAIVDHDCLIGAHCHLAPGSVLSGGVQLGERCHVGTGAAVLQGVRIGADALIAAGAVVVSDVPAQGRYAGVPARPMESR